MSTMLSPPAAKADVVVPSAESDALRRIRPATAHDIEKVSNTIYEAFKNYPYGVHVLRELDTEKRAKTRKEMSRLTFTTAVETGDTAIVNGGDGAILWWYGDITLDLEAIKVIKGDAFAEFMHIEEAIESAWNTKNPIARIGFLCVHPDHQGEGHGKALMLEAIRRIDEVSF